MLTRISFWMVLLFCSASVHAAQKVAPSSKTNKAVALASPSPTPEPSPSPTPEKTWSADWYNKYQFSLHTASDEHKSSSINSTLIVNYFTSKTFRIQGALAAVQAIQPSADFRVINPEFRGFWLLNPEQKKLRFYVGPTAVLPLGGDAKDESLLFGLGLAGRALLNLKQEDGSGWRSYYDLTFNKNFHQFETSVFAEVNNQLSLNHTFLLEYNFNSQWSINGNVSFSSLWNYAGVISNNYSVEEELDFSASDMLTIYVSHIRGGDFLSANGQNYSFGIFDRDSSRISIGAQLSF